MNYRKQVGARLLKIRQAKGWSQQEAAKRSGIGATQIFRMEHGVSILSLEKMILLAAAYACTLEYIAYGYK